MSFFPFCTIHADLSKVVKDLVLKTDSSGVYYQLDYDVIILFGFTELRAELGWKTRVSCGIHSLRLLLTQAPFQTGEER